MHRRAANAERDTKGISSRKLSAPCTALFDAVFPEQGGGI